LNSPVGFDKYSYSYRDVKGDIFHESKGFPYGEPFKVGDIVGCLIHIPKKECLDCIETREPFEEDGKKYIYIKKEESTVVSKDSFICFYLNGKPQGKAFKGFFFVKFYF
jgi:Set1/Ash2 histone methyltransferase complex subunit ASH2